MAEEPRQFWVRSDKGKVWGPLTYATLELLVANGLIDGKLQASRDGIRFAFPGQFPELRDAFPRELWGVYDELPESGPSGGVLAPAARPPASARPVPPSSGPPPVLRSEPAAPAPPPRVETPRRAAAGDLAAHSPLSLYYRLAAEGFTGRLALTSGSSGYEIFFKKGAPEAVRPSRAEEDLGTFLVERGGLAPKALEDARRAAQSKGGDVVAGLFALQLINPAQAFTAIGEHAVGLLRRALALKAGSYAFEEGTPLPSIAMPLGDRWALACDAVRALPAVEIKSRLGERFDLPIMRSGGRIELGQLRLTPQEARAASAFDGVRSVAALVARMPAEADALTRTALLMASFELVSFAAERPEPSGAAQARPPEPAPKAAAPPPGPARPAPAAAPRAAAPPVFAPRPPPVASKPAPAASAPAADMAAAAVDLDKLRALAGSLRSRNHFDVLGLPKEALGSQVKQAYFALAKLYHPDTILAGGPPEVARLKSEVFTVIGEAYRVLGDDKARAAYLEELKAGGGSQEQLDAAAIFAAEEAFQKGCVLVKARKYADAVAMLEEAVRLNEKEGEFWAWRGWAAFLASKDKVMARAAALKDVDLALKLNPKCAQACYLAGQILKLTGDAAGALKWFKKTLTVDPKHIDAQREVRLAGGR